MMTKVYLFWEKETYIKENKTLISTNSLKILWKLHARLFSLNRVRTHFQFTIFFFCNTLSECVIDVIASSVETESVIQRGVRCIHFGLIPLEKGWMHLFSSIGFYFIFLLICSPKTIPKSHSRQRVTKWSGGNKYKLWG